MMDTMDTYLHTISTGLVIYNTHGRRLAGHLTCERIVHRKEMIRYMILWYLDFTPSPSEYECNAHIIERQSFDVHYLCDWNGI